MMLRFAALLPAICACATSASFAESGDADLDEDAELAAILDDPMPEVPAPEADTIEAALAPAPAARVACTKHRFLHVANWSFVGPLDECVNGACPNGCWGYQRRTSGFSCDYDRTQPDLIETRDGGGPFASYNEIKSLNASDAAAVANCRAQSGGRPVRTYAVWNGSGWSNEGITAAVKFAEIYGTQAEAATRFWTWFDGSRAGFAPMANVSPETALSAVATKQTTARLCSATRDGWLGLYYYIAGGGPGMADWKREAIIRGMNYCTTH
jgi:hypothetical protein